MAHALTLDQLITEACELFAPADASTRYYTAALSHAQAFRRELIAGTARELKTAYLELGADRTVDLPEDYVEYTMLGLSLPGWGAVRNLVYNAAVVAQPAGWGQVTTDDYLTPPTADECERACYGGLDADADGYRGYGVPGYGGSFRIDRAEGRIVCGSDAPAGARLVLEYYGFAACEGEDITLDPLAHSWGLNFILHRLSLQKKDVAMSREYERIANSERDKYKARTRNFSLGGAMQVRHQAAAQRWK